jgi:acetoin utilization deacetylase AcuC-like enzyme
LRVVYTPKHQLHDPNFEVTGGERIPAYEVVTRGRSIAIALEDDPAFAFELPHEYGVEPIRAVHSDGLIRYLESAWADWRSGGTGTGAIMADAFLHPALRTGMGEAPIPGSPCGQIGYWCFDTATPVLPGTYEATRAACDVALTAADAVLAGERAVYALTRPPGHHSAENVFGGYCYFNQAAVAVEWLAARAHDRVAVLDVDYHHGNGTQQIFYERDEVLYTSIHADPARTFPYFAGHADEIGAGRGSGTTHNQPLAAGTTDADFLAAIDRALEQIDAFGAAIVVVSLGFDTYGQDPIGDFALTTPVYHEVGRRVADGGRPLLVVQEGGYHLETLGRNAREWLRGCAGQPPLFAAQDIRDDRPGQ